MRSKFVLILLLVCALNAKASESAFQRNGVLAVEVSPNATYFALLKRQANLDEVIVVDVRETQLVGQLVLDVPERVYSVSWIDNERVAVQVGEQITTEIFPVPTGRIQVMSVSSPTFSFATNQGAENSNDFRQTLSLATADEPEDDSSIYLVDSLRGVPGIILATNQARDRLVTVDVTTGAIEDLEYPPLENATFTVSPGLKYIGAYGDSDDGQPRLLLMDTANESGWQDTLDYSRPLALNDAGELYVLHAPEGGPTSLVEYSVSTGAAVTVYSDTSYDVDEVLFDSAGKPVAARFLPGYPSWEYLDESSTLAGLHKSLRAAMPTHDVSIISAAENDSLLAAEFSTDDQPSTYFLVDRISGRAEKLMDSYSGLWIAGGEAYERYSYQPFETSGNDGAVVKGYISMPDNARSLERPLVVLIRHQAYENPWQWEYDVDVWNLNRQGFNVLMVNHAGPGQQRSLEELQSAISLAIDGGYADRNRICLIGRGSGADIALAAVQTEEGLNCIVSVSGEFRDIEEDSEPTDEGEETESPVAALFIDHEADDADKTLQERIIRSLTSLGAIVEVETITSEDGEPGSGAVEAGMLATIEQFLRSQIGTARSRYALPLDYYQAAAWSRLLQEFETAPDPFGRPKGADWFRTNDSEFRSVLSDVQIRTYNRLLDRIDGDLQNLGASGIATALRGGISNPDFSAPFAGPR